MDLPLAVAENLTARLYFIFVSESKLPHDMELQQAVGYHQSRTFHWSHICASCC